MPIFNFSAEGCETVEQIYTAVPIGNEEDDSDYENNDCYSTDDEDGNCYFKIKKV